ncbi:ATP-binding protein [Halorientalis pallida]|uniref:ATP-binding protein n=1 Tax=Halorientalis pallida TaxID=2479928 RepID=UPI00187D5472|nr:ATP-binding protein [Halorientalis pallida]
MGDGTASVDKLVGELSPAVAIYALAVGLLAVSLANFARELSSLGAGLGPILAVGINVTLSLGVCYGGYRLSNSSLAPARKPTVAVWCLGGAGGAALVVCLTVVVRELEGRAVPEPVFALVVVTALGGLFGGRIGFLRENLREEAARASEARDAMAFTNSLLRHDVRNGLQIMQGHAELVESADDDLLRESGRALTKQVDTLRELVEEVRAVSNVLLGEADVQPIDVVSMIDDVVETTGESFPDASVETDLPASLDARATLALKPVFTNLLNNAVQHSSDAPEVRVTGHRDADRVVISIADDGPGVPPDQRDRIFERGVTSDGGDGGLGLHIVATILDRTDGDIRVEDSDLGGAAFVVTLPASDE